MIRFLVSAAALALVPSVASATDINFTFTSDATSSFIGRTAVPGTVSGTLNGLAANGWSMPTSITFSQGTVPIGFALGTYTSSGTVGSGINLSGGLVIDADLLFNFNAPGAFQLRLDYQDMNLLHWNGSPTPLIGTGNLLGFAGATYGTTSAVPEPATWAMMISGFGLLGASMRRKTRSTVAYA
jgi:hypothetical protein